MSLAFGNGRGLYEEPVDKRRNQVNLLDEMDNVLKLKRHLHDDFQVV